MADNLNLNTGSGPTKSRAIDRGSDVFTQVAQIDIGGAAGESLVSAANPMPVAGTFWQATQPVSGTVAVSNMVAQGLTDAQLRATPVPISSAASYEEDTPHVSGAIGNLMLAIRSDGDAVTADNGDYTVLKLDEEGRLKVASKPASYAPTTGNITANGQTIFVNVERFSNLMIHCAGTFSTVNVTFEGSLNSTNGTDGNWFLVQAIRSSANTIETATGNLSAAPTYAWELSVNALKYFRVRATAWTSGTQVWTMIPGTYATEPIPGAQVSATQPVSGTVTANIGTAGLAVYTDSAANLTSAATFTGTSRDAGSTPAYNLFIANAYANQAGTLYVEKSTDNTNWRLAAKPLAVAIDSNEVIEVRVTARYHRVRYVNGGVAQTVFSLTSAYQRI